MNIDWGAGPAFETEEEWSEWQRNARRVCISHHHACQCREARFAEAMRLLRRLYDLQNGSPLDKYRYAWTVCMDEIEVFLKQNEDNT